MKSRQVILFFSAFLMIFVNCGEYFYSVLNTDGNYCLKMSFTGILFAEYQTKSLKMRTFEARIINPTNISGSCGQTEALLKFTFNVATDEAWTVQLKLKRAMNDRYDHYQLKSLRVNGILDEHVVEDIAKTDLINEDIQFDSKYEATIGKVFSCRDQTLYKDVEGYFRFSLANVTLKAFVNETFSNFSGSIQKCRTNEEHEKINPLVICLLLLCLFSFLAMFLALFNEF